MTVMLAGALIAVAIVALLFIAARKAGRKSRRQHDDGSFVSDGGWINAGPGAGDANSAASFEGGGGSSGGGGASGFWSDGGGGSGEGGGGDGGGGDGGGGGGD